MKQELKKRNYLIIKYLLSQDDDYITIKQISDNTDLTYKEVRVLLDEIDSYFTYEKLPVLIRKPNKGIKLDERTKEKLNQKEIKYHLLLDFTNSKDRQLFFVFLLLCSKTKINIEPISAMLDVSNRTLSSDIKALKSLCQANGIQLSFDKKRGYYISEGVFLLRNIFINELATWITSIDDLIYFFKNLFEVIGDESFDQNIPWIQQLNGDLDVLVVRTMNANVKMSIISYLVLLFFNREENLISLSIPKKKWMFSDVDQQIAKVILDKLRSIENIEIPEIEDYYFLTLLQSLPNSNGSYSIEENYPFEIEIMAHQFIEKLSDLDDFSYKKDPDLNSIIVKHLIPLINRALYNCQVVNPLLGLVKERFGSLHERVKEAISTIERKTERTFSEDEISFFTLYFASSKEKILKMKSKKFSVLIVCNSGYAVSRLIYYKLMNLFDIEEMAIVSSEQVPERLDTSNVDLIISVVPINSNKDIPIILVSPFLDEKDIQNINVFLKMRNQMLGNDVENCSGVLELLKENSCEFNVDLDSVDDLIIESGKLLVDANCCEEEYVTQMLNIAHDFGGIRHIMICKDLILPHAGISLAVKKTGMAFVKLKKPVSVEGVNVQFAIAFCTTDKYKHQTAIKQLGILLNSSEFIERLSRCNNYVEFEKLVNEILRRK